MSWWSDFFAAPVKALNDLRSNVYAVILISVGAVLAIHNNGDASVTNIGQSLIVGGFAILRSSDPTTAPVPPNAAPVTRVVETVKSEPQTQVEPDKEK